MPERHLVVALRRKAAAAREAGREDLAELAEQRIAAIEGRGAPAVEEPQPEPVVEESADDGPKRPAQNDPKADWVEYAVAGGLGRDEAEALTKQELIDRGSED